MEAREEDLVDPPDRVGGCSMGVEVRSIFGRDRLG